MSSLGLRKRESLAGGGGLAGGAGSGSGAASGSSSGATSTSVQVAVRIRPVTTHDLGAIPTRWQRNVVQPLSSNSLQVESGGPSPSGSAAAASSAAGKKQSFTFDRVLAPNDGQETVYQTSAEPLIHRFLEGYNVTILAYGQTSSGKSYTMGTSAADMDFESLVAGQRPDADMGIIPRAVAQIFSQIKQNQARSGAVQYSARASFIEIYNEELIDLLADADGDVKPLVQIREDKAGHIIWQGLREPKVNNVADVMNHLLQGSMIRRTNETDMNAQSSRSHAIFSLTLTQRKFVGSGPPPPPSAPSASGIRPPSSFGGRTTPTGRSTPLGPRTSSGLPRPASSVLTPNRVASPSTPSRPNTPGYGGLRPGSVIGGARSASAMGSNAGGEEGEWVTVTSKFHFVDLAGSERLKRTAAQGERAKEGISINAGLHALGNVISALGDPAKAKRTTHIPYRDSKLTRLLQDSLGGNAHTLMIACVSPTEYNVSETVNTLQYAHRARNIKNKAELNEVEVGWDDVEYLQGVVLKLRKEMAILRNAKAGVPGSEAALRNMERKEELEWRDKYTALSQKHAQLMAEVAKLQQMTRDGAQDKSNADFLEAAEPIIVEYEKTVDALEGQINLLKAAVSHAEDIITEQETELADKGSRLASAEQDLEMRETTITELQGRLAKLQDREATADSYARDLETRLAAITSAGDKESQVTAELRKEVTRLKEAETTTEQYVRDLEARLAKADDSVASLQAQVDRLEKEVTRRDEAYKELQQRLELLDNSKANKELLEELDSREQRLADLGRKLDELQAERDDVVRERGKLNDAAAVHQLERGKLEDRIRTLEAAAAAAAAAGVAGVAAGAVASHRRSDSNTGAFDDAESDDEDEAREVIKPPPVSSAEVESLRRELESLRASETKTKAELDSLNAKYRESLSEIQDLSHQITEAKLNGGAPSTPQLARRSTAPAAAEEEELEVLDVPESRERSFETGSRSLSRRSSWNQFSPSRPNQSTPGTSRGRPESLLLDKKTLSRRSSGSFLGYNPREQTPREGVPPSPIRSVHPSDSRNGSRASSPTRLRTRSLSQSLSQELGLGGRRPLSLSHSGSLLSLATPSRGSLNGSAAETLTPFEYERQIASLRKESQRLQVVLKERDDEIAALEKRNGKLSTPSPNADTTDADTVPERSASTLSNNSSDDGRFVDSMSAPDSGMSTPPPLTPATERELSLIKQLIAETRAENIGGGEGGDGVTRLEELMRSMARKEASNREQIEDLTGTVSTLQKENETLKNLARDQAVNMAAELEGLRQKLAEKEGPTTPKQANTDLASADPSFEEELASLRKQNGELKALAATASVAGAGAAAVAVANGHAQTDVSRGESAPASQLAGEHVQKLAQLQDSHRSALEAAEKQSAAAADATREKHARALEEQQTQHQAALDALSAKHAKVLLTTTQGHEAALQQRQAQHDDHLADLKNQHEKALASVQEEKRQLAEEHASKLSQLSREHDSRLQELTAKHTAELNGIKDDHASAISKLEAAQVAAIAAAVAASHKEHAESLQGSEAERAEKHAAALAALQNEAIQERTAALASAQERQAEELARQSQQHAAALTAKDEAHSKELAALRDQHSTQLTSAQDSHAKAVAEQAKEHEAALLAAKRKADELQANHDVTLREIAQEHGETTAQLKVEHQLALGKLAQEHGDVLSKAEAEHQAALQKAAREHGDASDKLRVEHAMAIAQLQESHEQALFTTRSEHSTALAAALAAAAKQHDDERRRAIDELTDGHDRDVEELKASHQAALEELQTGRGEEHAAELAKFKDSHHAELSKLHEAHSAELEKHRRDTESLRAELAYHADKLKSTTDRHAELERKHKEVSTSYDELEASHKKLAEIDPAEVDALRLELAETSDALVTLEGALTETQEERDRLVQELEAYKSGSADSSALSQHIETQAQLRKEVEKSQAALANIKTELLRSKSDIQGLLEERARQDSLLRETQIKLTISETRGAGRARGNGGGDDSSQSTPSDGGYASATGEFPPVSASNRSKRYSPPDDLSDQRSRQLSVSSVKPPPLTPPPSMPPPPTPSGGSRLSRGSTASSATAAAAAAGRPESPSMLSRSSSTASINTKHASIASVAHADPKTARLLSEQAEELRILAKQLSHCEQDLQANIDLVATLEAALNDSERNLRKSRVQLSEVTRERDRYAAEADDLRQQISMAQREADAVRNSVLLEKQGFESRLQAEREAKERARRALETRLEEVQRKKNSRLFCI